MTIYIFKNKAQNLVTAFECDESTTQAIIVADKLDDSIRRNKLDANDSFDFERYEDSDVDLCSDEYLENCLHGIDEVRNAEDFLKQ